MAIWKEATAPKAPPTPGTPEPTVKHDEYTPANRVASYDQMAAPAAPRQARESVIGPELTIEGKIDGAGHIRIAGNFKGDVNVEGNLTIEQGAKLEGGVIAHAVVIGGELDGNILDAAKVELLETGVLIGDLKAGSLTVAAGSRMRGRAEFGWDNAKAAHRSAGKNGGHGETNGAS